MQESSVYQHLLQKAEADYQRGFQQGARQCAIKTYLLFLSFGLMDAQFKLLDRY